MRRRGIPPAVRPGTACSPAPAAEAPPTLPALWPALRFPRSARSSRARSVTPPVGGYLPVPRLAPGQPMLTRPKPPQVHPARALVPPPGRLRCFPAAAQTSAGLSAGEALLPSIGSLLTISRAFNSFFKVLFIFPSQYLFAIGLVPIFSFR